MIQEFQVLRRVKQLKEDKALKALNEKRAEVLRCQQQLQEAERTVEASRANLGKREDAIYARVLGKVVGQTNVDLIKHEVKTLHREHQLIVDKVIQIKATLMKLEAQLEELRVKYRLAHRNREKYDMMLEILISEQRREADLNEESEIEELFTKGMKEI